MSLFDVLNGAVVAAFMERDCERGPVVIGAGFDAVEVQAVFDENFYAGDDGEQPSVDLVTTISIRTADAPSAIVGARVTARGRAYRITERRPDSEGMTVLELEKLS